MLTNAGKAPKMAVTTAGLRGTTWNADRLPKDVKISIHPLSTGDGSAVTGYLFRRGKEKTVVCSMHPREFSATQYLIPELLTGDCAVWVQGSRSPNNDLRLEHETAIIDLAAGQCFLRDVAGFQKTVLLGISGGGPLATFYCQQSQRAGADRISRSPAGRPTNLSEISMPEADGVILVSCHPGQGKLLQKCIDPSVLDEKDPTRTDPELFAFNPENGFRPPPESAQYSADFLASYRAAQQRRVARIDVFAKEIVARRAEARKRYKEKRDQIDAIAASHAPIFQVWRTDADPRCFDLSLEPSDRAYGTVWGANPIVSNFGSIGFARNCTAESWLSNWSALSSNASMEKCGPDLKVPTLMVEYTADNSVFASDAEEIFSYIGSASKVREKIHGNHHGRPVLDGAPNGQLLAGKTIRDWLSARSLV